MTLCFGIDLHANNSAVAFLGWHPDEGCPGSVQITWPCAGTEVFLERLGRLGPAIDRHAWILMRPKGAGYIFFRGHMKAKPVKCIRPLFLVLVQYDNLHAPVKGASVGRAVGLRRRVLTV